MGEQRRTIFSIIQLWVIVVGFVALIHQFWWWSISRKLIEASCYLLLFILLFSVRPIHNYFKAIPKPHQYLLATFFILIFIGQIANKPRLTFPFTSWAMYGRSEYPDTLVFYRYDGLNSDQERIFISPEEILPTVGNSAVASKFRNLVRTALSSGGDAERNQNVEMLRELLISIGQIYNLNHPDKPIQSLGIIQSSIDLRDRGRSHVPRKLLWQVDLSDGRLR